jgi:formate hydrogenlyase subunit 3/multisubunit Na+/H+ antiporter MnhD subunit
MLSNGARYSLIAILCGVIGSLIWAYVHQQQLQRRQLSLRSMFWLLFAIAAGINAGLWCVGFWDEFRLTMD